MLIRSSRHKLSRAALAVYVGLFAIAHAAQPIAILPDTLRWTTPPNFPAVKAAWIVGTEQQPGPYLLRVKLADNGRVPPHTHPDARSSTVLSGTLYVGFGDMFDETKMVAVPAGAVYIAPANVPHYVWARDGEVIYQEAGGGPTATTPLIQP